MLRYPLLFALLATCSQAITYYIDASCACKNDRGAVDDDALKEVKSMASKGLAKLNSNDETFNAAITTIFDRKKDGKVSDAKAQAKSEFVNSPSLSLPMLSILSGN